MNLLEFNRRQLLKGCGKLLTLGALSHLQLQGDNKRTDSFPAKAKKIIYICNAGGQSQLDLFDHKPDLKKWNGKELPESIKGNQRLTTMTSSQGHLKIFASQYSFQQNKKSGIQISDLLPNFRKTADQISLIKSMTTDEINHDPGLCYLTTGSNRPGKPSLGSWVSYGLGSLNKNLPSYVVMISKSQDAGQSVSSRFWSSGFLPSNLQATRFYSSKNPILYLKHPTRKSEKEAKDQIDFIKALNQEKYNNTKDSEILARTAQYELAFKMQSEIPELTDFSNEKKSTFELYGPDSQTPGSFAYNCLMARKLIEKDVKFVQLFHRGWDHHFDLPQNLKTTCQTVDKPLYALITDLKQRGLLDETLIVNTSEFGRTPFRQGSSDGKVYGRDHHGSCFSSWMAGAGVKKGFEYGETDEFSYNVSKNPVSINSFNATILKLMGINHQKLSYFHNGLEEKLTGVEEVNYIKDIMI